MIKWLIGLVIVATAALAQESPHGAMRFECGACHGTDSWEMKSDASFRHDSVGFPLTGQHRSLKCQACHERLQFEMENRKQCSSCHADAHKGELGTNCTRCHTAQSWLVTDMIQRHQNTRFPLLGRHATTQCQSCHPSAALYQYVGVPATCIGCHRSDFQATTTPNHAAAGFSTDCTGCHTVTASQWAGAGFEHALTRFPLTGAHLALPCVNCHSGNTFLGLSGDCVSCHLQSFNSASNPNHVNAGFSMQCQICHSTTGWQPATFDHSTTKFPLTGAHAPLACQSCHLDANYRLVYTGCVQCHLVDYQGTTNPNHASAGFPQTCQTCHSTTAWTGATFNHTWFPTNHGNAGGVCSTCHTNPLDYSAFQCTNCHTKAQTDPRHSGVSGYVYNSTNCYGCHPGGGGGG